MTGIPDALTGRLGRFAGVVFCLLASPDLGVAQGNFPIAKADLTAMRLHHYYPPPDKKLHEADFEWSFKKGTFTLKKGKAAIPGDLLAKLLPEGGTADEIEGEWELKDGKLVLSKIKAGKTEGRKDVTLSVYKTASTVVRIEYSDGQYVFSIGQ